MTEAQTHTLILGGRGQIGSALAERLRAQGRPVLRATRAPTGDPAQLLAATATLTVLVGVMLLAASVLRLAA